MLSALEECDTFSCHIPSCFARGGGVGGNWGDGRVGRWVKGGDEIFQVGLGSIHP